MSGSDGSGPDAPAKDFLIVGIGGSAGSIPSFREFFRNVPADSGMAYVIILHLSPDHESRLPEVLQTTSKIPVTQVHGQVRVEPDHVYVIPPNKNLAMADGELRVSDVKGQQERRAPVDLFFRSLADSHDSRAVCVVMSGSGSDGSAGLRRVKENNGLVIVQDPVEAPFGEMPRNSIATGLVDFVLPVAKMPEQIFAYRDRLRILRIPVEATTEADDRALLDIFTALRSKTGHDFSNYKRATVLRRIARRTAVRGLTTLLEYALYVRDHEDETRALLRELLISVTSFFRDPEVWDVLDTTVIPKLLDRKGDGDHVRVWVAGCATGEEAYSIAMLLVERASTMLKNPPILHVFASDLDEDAIARARAACYTEAEVADISPERLRRFFVRDGEMYRVCRELREQVLFARHNLIKDPPFSHLDLVSCRNLLIYLDRTAQQRAMEVLHFALEPEGFLLLGTAESVDNAPNLFSTFNKDAHIYQGRAVDRIPPLPMRTPLEGRIPRGGTLEPQPFEFRSRERLAPIDLHHRLLEEYAAPSLVVDEQFDIVHLSARAGRFLEFSAGEASVNVLNLVRDELRIELRAALTQAQQNRTMVMVKDVVLTINGRPERLDIAVRPVVRDDDPARGFLLVVFEEADSAGEPIVARVPSAEPAAQQLEEELVRLKRQMRASVEQYEVQAEEARAANEELQAMNEELRSTAEELETSKEELQSVNEELHTVNQELKVKIDEVGHSNDDLRNLMSSTDIGAVFVDRALRIKLFTPRVRDVFNLIASDIGRPLLDITSKIPTEEFASDIERVLDRLQPVEKEVYARDEQWYALRLLPYRTSEDRIDGVVFTFHNVTDRHRAEAALRESRNRLETALSVSRMGSWEWDPESDETTASSTMSDVYGLRSGEKLSSLRYGLEFIHPEDRERHAALVQLGRDRGEGWHSEFRIIRPRDGETAWLEERASATVDPVTGRTRMTGLVWDVTDRKRSEQALLQSEEVHRLAAEQALVESETLHRMIIEQARDYAILTLDLEGLITTWSTGAEAVFGWSAREAIGRSFDMTFLPEDREKGDPEKEMRAARESGFAPDVRWHLRKGGSRVFIDGTTRALRDAEGKVTGFVKIGQDVTERRKTEDALRASEGRYRTLFESIDEGFCIIEMLFDEAGKPYDYRFAETNPAFVKHTGLTDAVGKTIRELVPNHEAHWFEIYGRIAKTGTPERFEAAADAMGRYYEVYAFRVGDPERLRVAVLFRDITERKRAAEVLEERVAERTRELQALSASRQQLLERLVTAQEEERQRISREIHDEMGQHITALKVGLEGLNVEDVNRLTTIVTEIDETIDRLTLELRPLALTDLGIEGAISSLTDEFSASSGIKVDVHASGLQGTRMPEAVETTLYRVLQESLTNVWKHSKATTASVIVTRSSSQVQMIIEDNGTGFPDEETARGKFGLLGMRERVALVGGSFSVESEAGRGTTVFVRIPLSNPETEG